MIKNNSFIILLIIMAACTSNPNNANMSAMKKNKFIELKTGKKIAYTELNQTEFDTLKNEPDSKLLEKYVSEYDCYVYLLSDNSIIVHDDSDFSMFENFKDFETVLNDYYSSTQIMFGINIYKENFLKKKNELIRKLLNDLDIENNLPINYNLLEKIDIAILEKMPDRKEYYSNNFMNIIALVGDAIIEKYNVKWKMELSPIDSVSWNPYLLYNGDKIPFYMYYYEDLHINEFDKYLSCQLYLSVEDIIKINKQ
jgi:ribosomal protein L19